MEIVGRTLLGKYKVERLLGQGGMGSVWLARHVMTGRQVAVKILDDRFLTNVSVVQRFGREARTASAVQHEGIVEVLDLDMTEEGVPFLVMELLEGESLADRIERRGKLDERELVYLSAQLLDALHAAHERGVIHRDLKPDNIFVVPAARSGERVKILDFGISSKSDEHASKLTVTGSVLGTPHYMSPEQAAGDQDLDRRTDIYAAGIVLYECAVGAVPFDAANYNKLLRTILEGKPTSPIARGAMISPALEAVILRAMHRDKESRPATAAALRAEILAVASPRRASVPPGAPDAGGARPSSPPRPSPSVAPAPNARGADAPKSDGVEAPVAEPKWDLASFSAPAEVASPQRSRSRARLDQPAPAISGLDDLVAAVAAPKIEFDERSLAPARKPGRTSLAPELGDPMPSTRPAASLSPRSSGRHQVIEEKAPPPPTASEQVASAWAGLGAQKQRYVIVGVVSLCLFVAAVVGVRMLVRPETVADTVVIDGATPSDDDPATEAARDWVVVEIEGVPRGAELRLDGLPGVSLPLRIRRGTTHSLRITAPGYGERVIEVRGEESGHIDAEMVPLGAGGRLPQ